MPSTGAGRPAGATQHVIYVVSLPTCAGRRRALRREFANDASPPTVGGCLLFDVGAFDARAPAMHARIIAKLGHNATWWDAADPVLRWTKRAHQAPKELAKNHGCTVSHLLIFEHMFQAGLGHAVVLEDDAQLTISPRKFAHAVGQAVRDATRLDPAWDLMYLNDNDWAKRFGSNKTAVLDLTKEQHENALSNSSVEVAGCMAGTLSYVISSRGVAKMVAMKQLLLAHLITIDDMFMALGGRGCPWHWDEAAKGYAALLEPPGRPYGALRVLKTRHRYFNRRKGVAC